MTNTATCEHCGTPIPNPDDPYCSDKCWSADMDDEIAVAHAKWERFMGQTIIPLTDDDDR